jgi:hypothetical protein
VKIPSAEYLKEFCKPGCLGCCAYLVAGGEGFECAKFDSTIRNIIDQRLSEGTMRATGDNCDGLKEDNESEKPLLN